MLCVTIPCALSFVLVYYKKIAKDLRLSLEDFPLSDRAINNKKYPTISALLQTAWHAEPSDRPKASVCCKVLQQWQLQHFDGW